MPVRAFEAGIRDQQGVTVIDLKGEVDALAKEALEAAYAEAISGEPSAVLLNFEAVGYVDSRGIALIVGLLMLARKADRRLLVCGLSEHYREIFKITRLADFIGVFPDEARAIADALASATSDS